MQSGQVDFISQGFSKTKLVSKICINHSQNETSAGGRPKLRGKFFWPKQSTNEAHHLCQVLTKSVF